MAIGKQFRAAPLRSLVAGSVAASYTAIGNSVTTPIGIIHIQNFTDADVMISLDGIQDHVPIAAGGFLLLDVTTNHPNTNGLFLSIGTQFYVKQIGVPTTGSVYVSLYYGKQE